MDAEGWWRWPGLPPFRWLLATTALIVTVSYLHIATRSQIVFSADARSSLGEESLPRELRAKFREAQAYVARMEKEVQRLEREGHNKGGNSGGGGLQRFGSGARAPPYTPRGDSMIDIVVKNNVSDFENLRPDSSSSSSSSSASSVAGADDADSARWQEQLTRKLRCLSTKRGGIFLYHVRKAAGTSIKDVLQHASARWRVPLYETEGLSLDPRFLLPESLLSVLSMRDPVERVFSMYWYEHVGWYDGVLKQPEKCKSLREWVNAWRDGSDWKRAFMSANPRSVYVEIDNYYVKMLTGWTGAEAVGEKELEQAKVVLRHFDVVLLKEWMQDARQIDAMNAIFPGRAVVSARHMVRGDHKAKERLQSTLAKDEEAVRAEVAAFNKWDLKLWEFAQSLLARRLRVLQGLAVAAHKAGPFVEEHQAHASCGAHSHSVHHRLDGDLQQQLGIHRPPKHKGPF